MLILRIKQIRALLHGRPELDPAPALRGLMQSVYATLGRNVLWQAELEEHLGCVAGQ